jgi:hypothetical protein
MSVTTAVVPTVVELLNNANPVIQWAGPIIVVVLALVVGFFGVRFIISRIQSALGGGG